MYFRKTKKSVFIDEVTNYLNLLEDLTKEKEEKNEISIGEFEKTVHR